MKTIALLIMTAAVTMANSLPPCPENSLPPSWEMVAPDYITSIEAR